jgi:hypothetical protein
MRVKLLILAGLIVLGGVGANIIENFKNSPTGQVIEKMQEKKQLIEDLQKSPNLQIPLKQ